MPSTIEIRYKGLRRSKNCSHFFNVLLLLAALAAIGVAVWIFITVWGHPAREGALHVIGALYLVCNIVPAAIGIVVCLVVLIGVCGLCTTHRCTLLWYFTLLMVAFVLTIAAGIFNFIYYFELKDNISNSLAMRIEDEYGLYGFDEVTKSIDSIQIQFECCGSLTYEEWRTSEWHRFEGLYHFDESDVPTIPRSCCIMSAVSENETEPLDLMKCSHRDATYPNDYMYSQNCSELLHKWLELFTLILAIACAVLFIVELMAIAASAVLFRNLGPVHLEEKKLKNRFRGNPDLDRRRRHANSRV